MNDPVRAGLAITSNQTGRYYPTDCHRPVDQPTTTTGSTIVIVSENMPTKNYRIDEATYDKAMQRAGDDGTVLSTLIREWVTDYAAGAKRAGPGRPATVEVTRAELAKLRALIDGILS